jgi:hypothetical protein
MGPLDHTRLAETARALRAAGRALTDPDERLRLLDLERQILALVEIDRCGPNSELARRILATVWRRPSPWTGFATAARRTSCRPA